MGGDVGGPVFKNRTFFRGSYEHFADDLALTAFGTVPSLARRAGDFSAAATRARPARARTRGRRATTTISRAVRRSSGASTGRRLPDQGVGGSSFDGYATGQITRNAAPCNSRTGS